MKRAFVMAVALASAAWTAPATAAPALQLERVVMLMRATVCVRRPSRR